ncbi:hypothetical protein ACSTJ7_22480 [Vibrio parahaemolyticus]|uniref:hypothetical protein n=1 Tax=Vibrio parahaemolyticus TaxID=670 RepID=UPI001123DF0D|nr:hypothetical protein [Vibrio parahaemolyticus]TOA87672.1 hypothetical protein CGK17_20990 [Vibrio parahaemolyticus]TOG01508.1 hypothetical protein CGJ10_08670 [Vibrio parahaemolyticus]HCE1989071.1 hypothetical protein [Vibrio parahaemolyticus]HCE1992378.1 hypothetical protein [Vibrio parahaemolyticus]
MFTIDFEATLRKVVEQRKEAEEYLKRLEQMLVSWDAYSPYSPYSPYRDKLSRKKEEAKKRELLLSKANQLFQLIRFMIKHNHLLKRNRLFQLGEMFNLYRNIQQSRIDELNLMMDDKTIINRENKVRGELQWQQVFA